jgi:hypothetical protein
MAGPTFLDFHSHPAEEPLPASSHPEDVSPLTSPGDFLQAAVETMTFEQVRSTDCAPGAVSEESLEPREGGVDESLLPARKVAGAGPRVGWWLLPVVWFNAAFDACLTPFGPLGRCLCGRSGRSFLGSLGLLSLAAALALFAAFRMGWTW